MHPLWYYWEIFTFVSLNQQGYSVVSKALPVIVSITQRPDRNFERLPDWI